MSGNALGLEICSLETYRATSLNAANKIKTKRVKQLQIKHHKSEKQKQKLNLFGF